MFIFYLTFEYYVSTSFTCLFQEPSRGLLRVQRLRRPHERHPNGAQRALARGTLYDQGQHLDYAGFLAAIRTFCCGPASPSSAAAVASQNRALGAEFGQQARGCHPKLVPGLSQSAVHR